MLIYKRKTLSEFIKKEKFFTIFLFWSITTVLWSNYPFVSFKRFILYLTTITVPLSVLLNTKNSSELLKYFYYILGAYVLISILTIYTVPGALDRFGILRGIAPHKNTLGQISLISLVIFTLYFFKTDSLKTKLFSLMYITISIVLLIGSKSSTALFVLFTILGIAAITQIAKIFQSIGLRRTFSIFIIFSLVFLFLTILIVTPDRIEALVGGTGKDLTLTGRVDLWGDIWAEAQQHIVQGTGFRGYWVINSSRLEEIYKKYPWIPQQAHNGYIDIINELGVIGAILFILLLINYFANIKKSAFDHPWVWLIIVTIMFNIAESTILSPRSSTGVMFIFAYIALFVDIIKSKNNDYQHFNSNTIISNS